jgi:putative transposase
MCMPLSSCQTTFTWVLTPASDVPLEKAVQFLKGGFSFRHKTPYEVWDRGYFDERVRDSHAYDAVVRYVEQNPVRARIVASAENYRWSSATLLGEVDARPAWFGGSGPG